MGRIMKRIFAVLLIAATSIILASAAQAGPYAPAAGEVGSTAVSMDDASIKGWATGYNGLVYGDDVIDTWKTPEKALGPALGTVMDIVSLGNGGQITISFFPAVITNGEGADFVIFENALNDTFLELAYLEVSSDGVHFFRFPNDSLTPHPFTLDEDDNEIPLAAWEILTVDPENISGFASKYRVGYGTPFDLDDLDTPEAQQGILSGTLNLDYIAYVRIIDIIGDGSSPDSSGDPVYDPWHPTNPQTSAGFDLEAAGYMNYFVGGDLNLDDKLDMTDAVLALQILAGAPASVSLTRDADGKITLADVLFALSYLAEQ